MGRGLERLDMVPKLPENYLNLNLKIQVPKLPENFTKLKNRPFLKKKSIEC